jgi:hypothetical protein
MAILSPCLLWSHQGEWGDHVVEAYRLEDLTPPQIDGRLDDEAWRRAQSVSGFRQLVPSRGDPATDDTEVYILYDRYNLYVGFRCYDAEPEKIINRIARRGDIFPSDWISFYIDPHHDHRTGYKFSTTPGGIQQDESRFDDIDADRNWRGIWWVESRIDDEGWTAEFKIPFANFRFPENRKQVWGFDIERFNKRKSEVTVWKQMTQAGVRTRMSDLGHIIGFAEISSGKLFEITPYLLSGGAKTHGTSTDGQAGTGLDLQYNLTRALKTNLTINPDFAQVEADQLEINLTRFPTRFPEKRPFFVEGNSFFDTPIDLFFSRRIGSQGAILWGGKMTGKIGDYSVGVLASQTGNTDFLELGEESGLREEAVYSALRLKRDIFRRSNVGFLYAGKEFDGGHSRVTGVDGNLPFAGTYELSGQYAMSFHGGPDRRNSAISVELNQRNFLWDAAVQLERVEPLFETNQTGFLRKERYRGWQGLAVDATYIPRWGAHQIFLGSEGRITQGVYSSTYFSNWRLNNPGVELAPEFEEDRIAWEAEMSAGMELTEHPIGVFQVFYQRSREVELTDVFNANKLGFFVATNSARPVAVEIEGASGDFFNFARQQAGRQRFLSLFGTLRPRGNLAVEIGSSLARTLDQRGEVDGRFLVGSLRATYLFTRDTFVRVFAQTERQRLYLGGKLTSTNHLISALFGWEYSPKSHLFVAYNEDWGGTSGNLQLDDRVVVLSAALAISKEDFHPRHVLGPHEQGRLSRIEGGPSPPRPRPLATMTSVHLDRVRTRLGGTAALSSPPGGSSTSMAAENYRSPRRRWITISTSSSIRWATAMRMRFPLLLVQMEGSPSLRASTRPAAFAPRASSSSVSMTPLLRLLSSTCRTVSICGTPLSASMILSALIQWSAMRSS